MQLTGDKEMTERVAMTEGQAASRENKENEK